MLKKKSSKIPFYEEIKMPQRAHLWLNHLSSLGHLIVIAPFTLMKF
jgi:hypothetical protein